MRLRPFALMAFPVALALVASPLAQAASSGDWNDPTGDASLTAADIVSYSTDYSVSGLTLSVALAQNSYAGKRQSALTVDLDLNRDGKADVFVESQAPYREALVRDAKGRKVCAGEVTYEPDGPGAVVLVELPAKCTKYSLQVAASYQFIVSSDEENGLDNAGQFDQIVERPKVATKATAKRKGKQVLVTVKSDPLTKGHKLALQTRKGSSWTTLATSVVAEDGTASLSVRATLVAPGASARITWGRTTVASLRVP